MLKGYNLLRNLKYSHDAAVHTQSILLNNCESSGVVLVYLKQKTGLVICQGGAVFNRCSDIEGFTIHG